jgi:hypothetical protein
VVALAAAVFASSVALQASPCEHKEEETGAGGCCALNERNPKGQNARMQKITAARTKGRIEQTSTSLLEVQTKKLDDLFCSESQILPGIAEYRDSEPPQDCARGK